MQYQVELTKKTYEKLIEGLVKVEEEKENLLNDFSLMKSKKETRLCKLLRNMFHVLVNWPKILK